jgi:nucleotide-binding universal stress UspA family protein
MSTGTWANVLVPLDGSALAEQALEIAASLAHRTHATLHLATVQVPTPAAVDDSEDGPHGTSTGREVRQDVRQYLAVKAEQLAITHGVRFTCAVLHGSPAEALADYVRAKDISLVVMTAHGRSGVSRCWLGSVADRLVRRVTAPVLLLRPAGRPLPQRFYRLLVAVDGSAGSRDVVAQAVALGSLARDTEYALVEVVEPPAPALHEPSPHPGPDPVRAPVRQREAAAQDLERLAAQLRKRGAAVTAQVVVAERVGERLIELADSLGSDLIVVGTQRPRAVERPLLGSVADKVLRGATQPILLVPLRKRSPLSPRRAARHAASAAG